MPMINKFILIEETPFVLLILLWYMQFKGNWELSNLATKNTMNLHSLVVGRTDINRCNINFRII